MSADANWVHLSDRGFDLPVAIFDLDGVLSDAAHRQHFLASDPPDWDGFGSLSHLDDPIEPGRRRLVELREEHLISVVTARPADMREVTVAWFERHRIDVDLVVFRASHDRRPSPDVKRDVLYQIRDLGGDVRIAYDDDLENVEMYGRAGVHVVYVHSGYYDQGKV